MNRKILLSVTVVICLATTAQATPTISAGTHALLPNMANQNFDVLISGGDFIQGIDLVLRIADGLTGPAITGADLTAAPDLLFHLNNHGVQAVVNQQYFSLGLLVPANMPLVFDPSREVLVVTTIDFPSGPVAASGILAHITVSTVGVPAGTYPLSLSSTLFGPTDVAVETPLPNLVDGLLTVGALAVPEPTSIVLGLFALAGFAGVVVRKRRATRAA